MVALNTTFTATSSQRGTSMPLFARVFVTVLDSSIAEDFTLRHVFEDLFKLCDWKTGVVDMTRQAIARRLNIPLEVVNKCIDKLESPDPASRDPDHEGRRIARLDSHRDWGWRILNWQKYDAIRNRADAVVRVQRHREKKKDGVGVTAASPPVSTPPPQPPLSRIRSTNRPGDLREVIEAGKMIGLDEVECRKFWDHYEGTAKQGPENIKPVWVTGSEENFKIIGNWKSVLSSWKSRNDEKTTTHRAAREDRREPGKPIAPLPVQTFTAPTH